MSPPDLLWQRLVRARGPEPVEPTPAAAVPPWFARRVVQRWLSTQRAPALAGWERTSRQGLACAVLIMLATALFHARVPHPTQPWELLATESVLSSVLPR